MELDIIEAQRNHRCNMREIRLALVGFGNVGQAFARLIMEKKQELEADYDFTPIVTGIITSRHAS